MKILCSIFSLLIFSLLLTSANYAPSLEESRGDNRGDKEQVETKQQKKQAKKKARLNKRLNKLSSKLDATKKEKKQSELKKKIKKIKKQQDEGNSIFGTLSLAFGITALSLILLALLTILISLFIILSGGSGSLVFLILFAFALYAAIPISIASITLGIIGMVLADKKPEKFSGRKKALIGLILGSVALALLALFFIITLGSI